MIKNVKEVKNAGGFSIQIIQDEDGTLYAYNVEEVWNGEYYKGWKCDVYGEAIDDKTYNIKPVYEEVDGEFVIKSYDLV